MMKRLCWVFVFILLTSVFFPKDSLAEDQDYTVIADLDTVSVLCSFPKEHKDAIPTVIEKTKVAFDYFTHLYGKIDVQQITVDETIENTESALGSCFYGRVRLKFDTVDKYMEGKNDGTIAHEVSHLWWGGDLAIPPEEIWLVEGMARFSENYYKNRIGLQKAKDYRLNITNWYTTVVKDNDIPLADLTYVKHSADILGDMKISALIYEKGAYVLDMLRTTLGDEQFFTVLKEFRKEYPNLNASTKTLEDVILRVTGKNLNWFFNQWVYRAGYPKLEFKSQLKKINGMDHVLITITQKGDLFKLNLPLIIDTTNGRNEYNLDITKKENTYDFAIKGKIISISLDPDYTCLKQVEGDVSDLNSKAEKALAADETEDAIKLLNEALLQEPYSKVTLNNLAQAYDKQGKTDEALEIIERILKRYPSDSQAMFLLFQIYDKQGKNDAVIRVLKKLTETETFAFIPLAQFYEKQGKVDDQIDALEKLVQKNQTIPMVYLMLSQVYSEKKKDYPKAFTALENCINNPKLGKESWSFTIDDTNITDVRAIKINLNCMLLDLAFKAKYYNKVKEIAESIKGAIPEINDLKIDAFNNSMLAQVNNILGNVALIEGKNTGAINYFTDALKYKDKLFDAILGRAKANLNLKNIDAALSDCDYLKGIKKDLNEPQLAKLYLLYGNIFDLQKKRDEAVANYEEVLKLKGEQEDLEAAKQGLKKAFK